MNSGDGEPALGRQAGVVVLHLVVVPDHDERKLRVHGLQIGVELVERVPQPIGAQVDGLSLEALRRRNAAPGRADPIAVLVGVVAEVEHQIEIVLQHVPIGGVVAARPVLAGREREAELTRRARGPRGAVRKWPIATLLAAGSRTDRSSRDPGSSPSTSTWTECASSGGRDGRPARDDVPHAAVARDAPADGDGAPAEARGVRPAPAPAASTARCRPASGSPEATPSVNGLSPKRRAANRLVAREQRQRQAGASTPDQVCRRNRRRSTADGSVLVAIVVSPIVDRGPSRSRMVVVIAIVVDVFEGGTSGRSRRMMMNSLGSGWPATRPLLNG